MTQFKVNFKVKFPGFQSNSKRFKPKVHCPCFPGLYSLLTSVVLLCFCAFDDGGWRPGGRRRRTEPFRTQRGSTAVNRTQPNHDLCLLSTLQRVPISLSAPLPPSFLFLFSGAKQRPDPSGFVFLCTPPR